MVVVYRLSMPESEKVCQFNHPIKSVAIAPNYSRSPKLVFGFTKLSMIFRGALSRHNHTDLADGHGLIRNLRWRRGLILWADDECVCVYDVRARRPVTYLQHREEKLGLYRRTLPCYIGWQTDTKFAIGRGQVVHICEVVANSFGTRRVASPDSRAQTGLSPRSSLSSLTAGNDSEASFSTTSSERPDRMVSWSVEVIHQFTVPASDRGRADLQAVIGVSRHRGQLLVAVLGVEQSRADSGLQVDLFLFNPTWDGPAVLTSREQVPFNDLSSPVAKDLVTLPLSRRVLVSLESIPGENCHYIATVRQLICANELSADDRIDWLVEHDRYLPALDVARNHRRCLSKHSVSDIGVAYADRLLQDKQFLSAAELLPQVLDADKAIWEEQILKFMHLGQLQVLAPHIPTGNGSIQLESRVYEKVLVEVMSENADYFHQLLQTWQKQAVVTSYDAVLSALTSRLERLTNVSEVSESDFLQTGCRSLWQALAHIYSYTGCSGKAVDLLVTLKDPAALDLVDKSGPAVRHLMITEVLRERIVNFMQLDVDRTVTLLLDNVEEIPPEYVVEQLEPNPPFLYRYLDSLYHRLPQLAIPYLIRLVQLYILFGREKLLPLLQSTDRYPLSDALALCQQAQLVKETVYLLTRVGRRHDALKLILTRGGDLDESGAPSQSVSQPMGSDESEQQQQTRAADAAIAYCREQDFVVRRRHNSFVAQVSTGDDSDAVGGELWLQVILYAVDKPAFVRTLLQHAEAEGLDARLLLRKLSPDMQIPGLKRSLVKLLSNHRLQLNMHRSCVNILRTDVHLLFSQLLTKQTRGTRVECTGTTSLSCSRCQKPLFSTSYGPDLTATDPKSTSPLGALRDSAILFNCKHVFHRSCASIFDNRSPTCPICNGGSHSKNAQYP